MYNIAVQFVTTLGGRLFQYISGHGKVFLFVLLRRAGRPPNRQNLNYYLGKTVIGGMQWVYGKVESKYSDVATSVFPGKEGTRNLKRSRIEFQLSKKSWTRNMNKET